MAKEEKTKGGSKLLVTILVVILLLVFLGLGYAMGGTKVVEKVVEKKTVANKDCDSSNAFRTIDADSLINTLWGKVNFDAMLNISDLSGLNYDGLKVTEMTDDFKGNLASHYYLDTADREAGKYVVTEKNVRYAYDSIFGPGTYKEGQKIAGVCGGKIGDFVYDSTFKRYVGPEPACGGTSIVGFIETIQKVEKSSKQLKITSSLGVYRSGEQKLYKTRDEANNGTNAIEDFSGSESDANDYIKSNASKFNQYVYTFEITDSGFYKYTGYEKIA